MPARYLQDTFTETLPLENFSDTITQTVAMSTLDKQQKGLVVGQIVEMGIVKAKVMKIEGDNVLVGIENTKNPFYGKKIVVGLSAVFE